MHATPCSVVSHRAKAQSRVIVGHAGVLAAKWLTDTTHDTDTTDMDGSARSLQTQTDAHMHPPKTHLAGTSNPEVSAITKKPPSGGIGAKLRFVKQICQNPPAPHPAAASPSKSTLRLRVYSARSQS